MSLFEVEPLKMPDEFKGNNQSPAGGNLTEPRQWTNQEVQWCIQKREEGYSFEQIADATDRTFISVKHKLKRVTKTTDTYNAKNRDNKYAANQEFLKLIKPKKVLDVYAGESWWDLHVDTCWTNDIDKKFHTDYHEDALQLLCGMYRENEKFDLIDLDPYGSAYDCFDLAVKMAKKGLVISFGEWGHKRWKRFDYVQPRYGISSYDEFTEDFFIAEVKRIAECNKKIADPVISAHSKNFLRIYFKIEPMKKNIWKEKDEQGIQRPTEA